MRYREVANAHREKAGGLEDPAFCYQAMDSLLACARLHEVLNPFTLPHPCCQHGRIAPVCYRLRRAKKNTHAPAYIYIYIYI